MCLGGTIYPLYLYVSIIKQNTHKAYDVPGRAIGGCGILGGTAMIQDGYVDTAQNNQERESKF